MNKKSSKRKSSKKTNRKDENLVFALEYYQMAFFAFIDQLKEEGRLDKEPHLIRREFWSKKHKGVVMTEIAHDYIVEYVAYVENEMKQVIEKQSLAYWLHLYRRLFPGAVGEDRSTATVGLTRAILEAGIQKYASTEMCNRVGDSQMVPIQHILRGALMPDEWQNIREMLTMESQLVLTDFGVEELREFFQLEKLAYEVWRAGALLRSIAKGAVLVIENSAPWLSEIRTDELDKLISSYDERIGKWMGLASSRKGVVVGFDPLGKSSAGIVFLPTYNVARMEFTQQFADAFEIFGVSPALPKYPNFILMPWNLQDFYQSHKPYSEAFGQRYALPLEHVLVSLASILIGMNFRLMNADVRLSSRVWQRAYDGPVASSLIREVVSQYWKIAAELLGIATTSPTEREVDAAIAFWTLQSESKKAIDLLYPGPHYLFLPVGYGRCFLDYAWIFRRLHDLFIGIKLSDENFKGKILEDLMQISDSHFPSRLRYGDEQREADAIFILGDRLVVLECKANVSPLGLERGNLNSMLRRINEIERALEQVDSLAFWLAKNPKGANYDISSCKFILPLVIMPHVEFIPSTNARYWITDDIPRILTPPEFRSAYESDTLTTTIRNLFVIGNQL